MENDKVTRFFVSPCSIAVRCTLHRRQLMLVHFVRLGRQNVTYAIMLLIIDGLL